MALNLLRVGVCLLVVGPAASLATAQPKDKPKVFAGNAQVILLNDELATKKDRKTPGAIVLKPETLIVVTRMAGELAPPEGMITFVFDGQKAHVITLKSFDPKEKIFTYWDTTGNRSFLEEDNNRAGVKAKLLPGKERGFGVSAPDLQKVLQGIILPLSSARHYLRSADLDMALTEYGQLRDTYPKSEELKEARLLKAARLLSEAGEEGRAVNIYAACVMLHKNSARSLAGIGSVYAKTGKLKEAQNFFADAIKQLATDQSLDDGQRKQLAAEWESARRAVQAKNASEKKNP